MSCIIIIIIIIIILIIIIIIIIIIRPRERSRARCEYYEHMGGPFVSSGEASKYLRYIVNLLFYLLRYDLGMALAIIADAVIRA
jgi:NADH:ubiquinone oxidoreductase subunit 3 (subunit A)